MKSSSGVTRYTLDLQNDLHRRLRVRAAQEGRPASDMCRELIENYLAEDDAQDNARIKNAYEAGVRAERERIASAVRPLGVGPGLPTRPPETLWKRTVSGGVVDRPNG